jgi:FKBP12-rapamycin complex-associated protein
MLDRLSGQVVHIDFGDCFDVAVLRDKFPERVPFRLTRMLVNAMEVSGVEGTYRGVCESVLRILRSNSDSVMTMLEAFVHDPLINWGASSTTATTAATATTAIAGTPSTTTNDAATSKGQLKEAMEMVMAEEERQHLLRKDGISHHNDRLLRGGGGRTLGALEVVDEEDDEDDEDDEDIDGIQKETLNEKAVSVLARVQEKLTGRDLVEYRVGVQRNEASDASGRVGEQDVLEEPMGIPEQVDKLIKEAQCHENLSQLYIGWCPFW